VADQNELFHGFRWGREALPCYQTLAPAPAQGLHSPLEGIALSVFAFSGIAQPVVAQLVAVQSPVAVTLALAMPAGILDLGLSNPRLLAGAAALAASVKVRNPLPIILAGMAVLWSLQWLAG
jgi:hypothetical protein